MVIQKFRDSDELSQAAAKAFIELANQAIAERGRFLVSLSGGSTPMKLYERLANEKLDWTRVHFFWGDERCVPVDDPGNTYGQTKKILFDKIGMTNIHRIESELEPDSASVDYAHTLSGFADAPFDFPRFDLVLLGMGDDGHTASLFPGSPVHRALPRPPRQPRLIDAQGVQSSQRDLVFGHRRRQGRDLTQRHTWGTKFGVIPCSENPTRKWQSGLDDR
jgi:6-phosphogluconolactonase